MAEDTQVQYVPPTTGTLRSGKIDGLYYHESANSWSPERTRITASYLYAMNPKAELACRLLEARVPMLNLFDTNNNDTVNELCDLANFAFHEFDRRGWLLELPEPAIVERKVEETSNATR